MGFFSRAFENMSEEDRESFYRTVFMNDSSAYAQKLRNEYYRTCLGFMGENVNIGVGVKIKNPQLIRLEDNVTICDGASLIARDGTEMIIGACTRINDRVYLDTECAGGYIHIGPSCYIGTGTTLFGHKGLEIGDHVLMAQNITLTPYSHIFDDPEVNIIKQGGHCKKVSIGRDVYVGMGVCIMYSGDIGEGSVIGAGSVVVKPIPPYSVAVGCPAKVIRKREK
jgi:acetyltransferase-like isoleucine patch superfamily enzyme